jgi:hypothetical protein
MAREWFIGGSRYGPNGQNLGPVSSGWFSQQSEPDIGPFVNQDESALSLVVEGSLATSNGSGLPVRLWGCRMRIAYESVMALEVATVHGSDVVLFRPGVARKERPPDRTTFTHEGWLQEGRFDRHAEQ